MQPIDLKQIDSSYSHDFYFVIDATEGRLTADMYVIQVSHQGKPVSALIKAIGIGVDPKVWLVDDLVVVQANSGIWLLQADSDDFKEVDFGYPVYDVLLTSRGFLVFHLFGCELVSLGSGHVLWRHLGGELTDFTVSSDIVSLKFGDDGVRLDLDTGSVRD